MAASLLTRLCFYRLPETLGTQGHPVIPPRFGESSLDYSLSHPYRERRAFDGP